MLEPEDKARYIIVMGPTGSGKSTFISTATKDESALVGHGLKSVTSEIHTFRVQHNDPQKNYPIVFVDTPGFDDTYKSDTVILGMVAGWFMNVRQQGIIIEGIIYMHRITDNRMAGSLLKNLQLFKDLCGTDAMPKVIVVTTMWGEVREESGMKREEQLKKEFWDGILKNGGSTARFMDSHASAWDIIGSLSGNGKDHTPLLQETTVDPASNGDVSENDEEHVPQPLEIQTKNHRPAPNENVQVAGNDEGNVLVSQEMVDHQLPLNETHAGITLNNELKKLVKDQKDASRRLRVQAGKQRNEQAAKELLKRKAEIEQKIDQVTAQLGTLKISFTRSVAGYFTRRAFRAKRIDANGS